MKKWLAALAIMFQAFSPSTYANINILKFAPGNFSIDGGGTNFTVKSLDSTGWEIQGNDMSSSFLIDLANPTTITSYESPLQLTAVLLSNVTSYFQIELVDDNLNGCIYQGSYALLTLNTMSTVDLSFVSLDGAFDGKVSSILLIPNGPGSNLDIKLESLDAVPEPTSCVLLGAGMLFLVASRLHRKAQQR